jgi:hypothetical protein
MVITEKADRLIAMHMPWSHDAWAAVAADVPSEEPDMVAALQGARSCKGKTSKRPQQEVLGRHIDLAKKSQEQGHPLRTSMCFYHTMFGKQAKFCQEGCVWPEN